MAKKNTQAKYDECPLSITKDDPFYGMILDDEQLNFVNAMLDRDVLFCGVNACAGTGKTLLAIATGYMMVQYGLYDNIVYITAPVQEEKLGYMPGDLQTKVSMYMEPLYQALVKLGLNPYTCVAQASQEGQKTGGLIDATTHVFMRGINLERKFIVIDEAENLYLDEARKVLTRCHDNSKVVMIGHTGQIDLYHHPENSGFARYLEHFRNEPYARICELHKNYRGVLATHADKI